MTQYNTTKDELEFCNGDAWIAVSEAILRPSDFLSLIAYISSITTKNLDPTGDGAWTIPDLTVLTNWRNTVHHSTSNLDRLIRLGIYDLNEDGIMDCKDLTQLAVFTTGGGSFQCDDNFSDNVVVTNKVTANSFEGDGSGLTGITATANGGHADTATLANTATQANNATTADSATHADSATSADTAIHADNADLAYGVIGDITLSTSSTLSVTTAGVAVTNSLMRVQGNGGDINITNNPQVSAGANDGQLLVIKGMSDSATVTFEDGDGLALDTGAPFEVGANDTLTLIYDKLAGIWIEVSRSDR
tara:strand:- start:307 stop:1221 length:915 start_codon:yes stop_codon:yes gene_type:complete